MMSGGNIGSTIIPIVVAVEGNLDPLDKIINKYQSASFPGLESMAQKLNMASESLGNLSGKMDMNALAGGMSSAQLTANSVNAATAGAGRASRGSSIFMEFGRGFEDFMVSASMAKTTAEGLAMGLRGSANNINQMVALSGLANAGLITIGVSLATVIVPAAVKWLMNTTETEAATKRLEEAVKRAGEVELKAAKDIAEFRGTVRKNEATGWEERGKDVVKDVERQKQKTIAAAEESSEIQKRLNRKDFEIRDIAKKEELKLAKEIEDAVAGGYGTAQEVEAAALFAGPSAESKQAKSQRDLIKTELDKADELHQAAMLTEKEMRTRYATEIAESESDIKRKAEQKSDDEHRKLVDKQAEEDEKRFKKKIEEDIKAEHDIRVANIDKSIEWKQEEIDATQKKIEAEGKAAGPTKAMVSGTQSAESAIARAMAGTASQENSLKSLVKIQEKALKALQKEKKTINAKF